MNQTPSPDPGLPPEEKSPLEFWAAYIPGEGTQRHYLSNGLAGNLKGIRLFKSKKAAHDYLKLQVELGRLPQEAYERIVVHAVEGKLALPAELQPRPYPFGNQHNLKAPDHLNAITTLHKPSAPTAVELLEAYQQRKKKRRRY